MPKIRHKNNLQFAYKLPTICLQTAYKKPTNCLQKAYKLPTNL